MTKAMKVQSRQNGNSPPVTPTVTAAIIRQLCIERFRGIKTLKWNPAPGLNVVLGGGDVGKTTILEAIALLLSPTNNSVLFESDYFNRDTMAEFLIRAVLSLPPSSEIGQQQKFAWPWEWNGSDAVPPVVSETDDLPKPVQPVYVLQVRGTPDLELVWEILQPNDEPDLLSTAVRRNIGVVRLSADDRNDRDLRLVYGSALDRLLADQGLRGRIGLQVSEIDFNARLSEDARKALDRLDQALKDGALPSNLELGLTSAQGLSIGALIGLLANNSHGTSLPLASWGAGTRRMATLEIAAATQSKSRIAVIDEVERGLEPYRVRKFISSLQGESTQTFVTTHSPVAINAASSADLWYVDSTGKIGALPREKISHQQRRDPETFLARLPVIAEGPTEIGFLTALLEKAIDAGPLAHGVRVCDGQGTPTVLGLLEALESGGLRFGAFVDHESENPLRWATLQAEMGDLLFRWSAGCTEERVIALVDDSNLLELIKNEDEEYDPERRKTLAERLGIPDTTIAAIQKAASKNLRAYIVAAATGSKAGAPNQETEKTWKKHGQRWFKSEAGGRELAAKMTKLGVWPKLKPQLLPFLNAVRSAVGQLPLSDIPP